MAICNLSNTGVGTSRSSLLNTSIGPNALLEFYTGSPPADPSVAATGTLLATLTGNASAFGVVTAGVSGGAAPYLTANSIASANGVATGTPGYVRVYTSGSVAVVDMDCGASGSGASVIMTPDTITSGSPVSITSLTITEP